MQCNSSLRATWQIESAMHRAMLISNLVTEKCMNLTKKFCGFLFVSKKALQTKKCFLYQKEGKHPLYIALTNKLKLYKIFVPIVLT